MICNRQFSYSANIMDKKDNISDILAGKALRKKVQGPKSKKLQSSLAEYDEELAEWVDGFVFGTVWQRPNLSEDQRILIAITALAAIGRPNQLRAYLFGALYHGIPQEQIQEALVMLTIYIGFPAAIDAIQIWHDVKQSFQNRKKTVETELK